MQSGPAPFRATLATVSPASLAEQALDLDPGRWLTVVGISAEAVGQALKTAQRRRGALLLSPAGDRGTEAILHALLDDLADLALACWPDWPGRDADEDVSKPWLRAAAKRAAAGHRPRFRHTPRATEFKQLMRAIVPVDPVLIAAIDPSDPRRARPMIQVMEWCAGQGASVVATLPSRPADIAPYDRILYGAREVAPPDEPAQARFVVPSGRAHPASAIEQRIEAALRRDPELAPLFAFNETVAIHGYGAPPRVDLLWRDGRVVVELDGPEHQGDAKFASDRHRDYELLVAGYLVLRITNDQVAIDLSAAIEKIRAVVRFRQLERQPPVNR